MENSQAVKILRTFTKPELRSFEKFVNSPYYNTSQATAQLFSALKKFYPAFSGPGLGKEKLFERIYGKRKFSLALFEKLSSNLLKLSENFISDSVRSYNDYTLLYGLRKKKLYNRFLKHLKTAEEKVGENFFYDDNIVLRRMYNEEMVNYFIDTYKYAKSEALKHISLEYTSMFFLYRVIQLYPQRKIFSKKTDPETDLIVHLKNNINFEGLYSSINTSKIKNKEFIAHLLKLIILIHSGDDNLYKEIRDELLGNPAAFDTEFIYSGFIYLLNHCTQKISSGDESYYRERYLIYRAMEKGYFASGKMEIQIVFYRNFIISGIVNDDVAWADEVQKRYAELLIKQGQGALVTYQEAFVNFGRGEYEQTLKSLSKFEKYKLTNEIMFLLYDSRMLRLMTYYELGHFEEALNLADSVSHFQVQTKFISTINKPLHINFVKFFRRLVRLRLRNETALPENFMSKLLREKVYEKKWLLRKAAELSP